MTARSSDSHEPTVSSTEYGDDWPLTISKSRLYYKGIDDRRKMVWVKHDGVSYLLNGTAKIYLDRVFNRDG